MIRVFDISLQVVASAAWGIYGLTEDSPVSFDDQDPTRMHAHIHVPVFNLDFRDF